jgi:hypothetical protein
MKEFKTVSYSHQKLRMKSNSHMLYLYFVFLYGVVLFFTSTKVSNLLIRQT